MDTPLNLCIRSNGNSDASTSIANPGQLGDYYVDDLAEARRLRERERSRRRRANESESEHSDRLARQRQLRTLASNLDNAAFHYSPDIDYSACPLINIGKLDHVCTFCKARRFRQESKSICCGDGKIRLETLRHPPEPLYSYFSGMWRDSEQFLKNIRLYNSCFQMTSFGVRGNIVQEGYTPTFRIQGQIYHRIGSLLPFPDAQPKFLQIYFMGDANAQLDVRCNIFQGVQRGLLFHIQEILEQNNNLIRSFKTALELIANDQERVVIRADRTPLGEHERRFNAPTDDEVAVVIVDGEVSHRDIVLQRRDSQLKTINETHPFYDALQYPLIFWQGNATYHFGLRQVVPSTGNPTNKKVSSMDYYSYQLQIRDDDQNYLLKCGNLLNQFVVDMWAKIEAERLLYLRLNQSSLRAEQYIHLRDAVRNDGNAADVGQRFILPSTFQGSPRHMHEYSQDAMAYVRLHGRPDLFITFTCNPKWKEITELLMPHQSTTDRHDLTSRVFKQKLQKLIDVITKHRLFGPFKCYMYTIEWQKRGLPHSHILIWLENRIRPEQIDDVLSAELPDPNIDPGLFNIVKKHMVHGPCGRLNPDSPCMDHQTHRCTKKFPRALINETQTGHDGYPLYRRRGPADGGQSTTIRLRGSDITIDNQWIVPYCPLLTKMFNAHINIEYCHSVKSIKYICKYINKGPDMAVVNTVSNNANNRNSNDEIQEYQLGRYLSSSEAFWRILGFSIHNRYPAVEKLSVHLENGQRVYFNTENAARIAENPPNTTLTAFFSLCRSDEFARTLLYTEVPTYYTWNKSQKIFLRRKRGESIGNSIFRTDSVISRMYSVHPNDQECFFLRILLTKIRGPTSFEDLRRFESRLCSTYREACQLRGLLENDLHWDNALSEAIPTRMPYQLRNLFAMIIGVCNPSNPSELWEKYKQDLSEDILLQQRQISNSPELDFSDSTFNQALIIIEDICLNMTGELLVKKGLPSPNRSYNDPFNSEVLRETCYNAEEMRQLISINLPNLVHDQRIAFNKIIEAVDKGQGGLFFLDAPGGTGKTFLINLILAHIRQKGEIVIAAASSGIAATLLSGGRTAHSAFKLPLDLARQEKPVCKITRGSAKGRMLNECKAIIWDECTMAHKKALEALDTSLRDLRRNNSLMGGVVVILSGDFRQTLPVIKKSLPADELNACLKQSILWRSVQKLKLTTNMRVHLRGENQSFSDKLLRIGDGNFPSDPITSLIKLPNDMCSVVSTVEALIERVFPDLNSNFKSSEWLCERAILAPTNDVVNHINTIIQDKLENQLSKTYLSVDRTTDPDEAVHFPTEVLNSFSLPGLPPHELHLKVGSPVILLRNLDPPKLCNGTRLVVKHLNPNLIEATIMSGAHRGENVFIPRIPMSSDELIVSFTRLQFPVRVAFAITINKSQGQSLKVVGINLSSPCFSHGQLYVACSRVGSPSNMFILAPEGQTRNIVYPLALQ